MLCLLEQVRHLHKTKPFLINIKSPTYQSYLFAVSFVILYAQGNTVSAG